MASLQFQSPQVEQYLERVRNSLLQVPVEEREWLMQQAKARVELALELEGTGDYAAVEQALAKLGSPEALAQKLRGEAPPAAPQAQPEVASRLAACRSCRKEVSTEAMSCPHCGAPFPARRAWGGRGYEWKSKTTVMGYPLVHVAYGRDENGKLRVAKGVVAIGQFGIGVITIAQFGVGFLFGLGQFMLAPLVLAQFAVGLFAVGQFALGLFALGMLAMGVKAIGVAALSLLK